MEYRGLTPIYICEFFSKFSNPSIIPSIEKYIKIKSKELKLFLRILDSSFLLEVNMLADISDISERSLISTINSSVKSPEIFNA